VTGVILVVGGRHRKGSAIPAVPHLAQLQSPTYQWVLTGLPGSTWRSARGTDLYRSSVLLSRGPRVRIPLPPAASPFSPVRREAAGKELRAFSNSLGWQVAAALVKPLACLSDRFDGNWPRGPEARSRARGICLRRKRQRIFLRSPSS